MLNKQFRAIALIVAAGIFWGTAGVFVEVLSPYGFTPLQMTAIRGIVSFFCMFVYVVLHDRKLLRTRLKELLIFMGMGLGVLGTATFYYMSMNATSVATAVVLMYTAPVYVMLFSVLFLGERLTPLKLVAVAVMLLGCCLVSGIIGGLKFDVWGIAFGLLSGLSYAVYNIFTKIAMQRGNAPQTATLYAFLTMGVAALAVCDAPAVATTIGERSLILMPLLLLFGVVTCFLPYILYTTSMKTLPAGTAASLAIVEPMAATVFSILIGQTLTAVSGVGIVLILLAVFLLGRAEHKVTPKKR